MTIASKTKATTLLVALLAVWLLVPPTTASAGEGVFTLAGTAHLSDGIGSNVDAPGCLGGVAVGAHGTAPAVASDAYAGFTYNNPDTLLGDAQGNLKIGDVEVGFEWLRIGGKAIVGFNGTKDGHTGHAVAAFAPVDLPLGSNIACNNKTVKNYGHGTWAGDEHAQVAGVGVISHVVPCSLPPVCTKA